jgi:RHS repeat-associated protein
VHSFQYNLAGNLTRTSDLNIDYRYDGHKRRVQEIDNNASQTTYSMYSQSGQLMHKLKGGVATDYLYAGSLLVAEKSGSTVDYMYTDLLGSPIAGNNGSAYKEHYRPWGEKKDHPLQLADDVGYTGHQSDIETGLTYMQARYYDPVVGRFYAVDPVGFSGTNTQQFGRYPYAKNNPYRYTDPDGRDAVSILEKVFATDQFAVDPMGTGATRVIAEVASEVPAVAGELVGSALTETTDPDNLRNAAAGLAAVSTASILTSGGSNPVAVVSGVAAIALTLAADLQSPTPMKDVAITGTSSLVGWGVYGTGKNVLKGVMPNMSKGFENAIDAGAELGKSELSNEFDKSKGLQNQEDEK